jgi:hypothetical protein
MVPDGPNDCGTRQLCSGSGINRGVLVEFAGNR